MKTERLDRRTTRELEQFLKVKQSQLKEAVRSVVSERRSTEAGRNADVSTWASETLNDEIQVALMDRQSRQVAQIDAALDRLARGEYGFCHDCTEFIGVPRLKALPFAHRCSACQARAERRARQMSPAAAAREAA
jgi:RNA polymerase-binding transcription factor